MPALIQFASGAPGIKYRIDQRYLSIGRDTAENDICLPCAFVSKHHAIIEIVEEEEGLAFYLQDLASTNHTYVNDRAIVRTRLHDGDMIRIGKNSFKFDASGPLPLLDAVELDFELPGAGETPSRTWNFSRRLRLIATE
ncbi:MAG: FHA domain-containing protein [Gammaproteobacteria bacterium]|jgi:pSer/pThr/pTyr-binding forkhead associated (FHA) protein